MNRKIVNWIIILVMVLGMFVLTPALVKAEEMSIKLPDGQELPVSGLNSKEINNLVKLLNKATKKKDEGLSTKDVIRMADNPAQLDAWRKVITGTIKDVCSDLNVTVNEFIKTPVGMGVAGLIVYKVIGRDLIAGVMRAAILIPLWFFIMLMLFYIRQRYFGSKITYTHKEETGKTKKGKPIYKYSDPERILNYPWHSDEARVTLGSVLVGIGIISTLVIALVVA